MIQDSSMRTIGVSDMVGYLFSGLSLALSKELRLFVIIPILINIVVLCLGGWLVVHFISAWLNEYLLLLPEWLSFLHWIVAIVLHLTVGFVFIYFFSTIATIIASPFYGLLAERTENLLRGASLPAEEGNFLVNVIKDIPRIIKRELQKQCFYIPRLIVCLLIAIIPVVNVVFPFLWFLLSAWMLTIQYVDYAYDNHKISFANMRHDLALYRLPSFGMGAVIYLLMLVPILNLIIPPAAVCAGTKYYVEMDKRYTIDTASGR